MLGETIDVTEIVPIVYKIYFFYPKEVAINLVWTQTEFDSMDKGENKKLIL